MVAAAHGHFRQQKPDRHHAAPVPALKPSSFWVGQSPTEFYATVRARAEALRVQFGSTPVSTYGGVELGPMDRAVRAAKERRMA